jgi:hypothetical protein
MGGIMYCLGGSKGFQNWGTAGFGRVFDVTWQLLWSQVVLGTKE